MTIAAPIDPRGSLWRKWDLHFHTPASFDYRGGNVSNEDIVNGLKSAGVSVVAITDHHTIDVARFEDLKSLGGDDIVFLPGIELRCELGGSQPIHYIGIFSEAVDVEELWTTLQGKLDLNPSNIKAETDERVYVP